MIDVPQEERADAAPRPPCLAERAHHLAARTIVEPLEMLQPDLQRQIFGRPDIRTAEREQAVDLGGPAPDALDAHQMLDDVLVVVQMQVVEPAASVERRRREVEAVGELLAAQ